LIKCLDGESKLCRGDSARSLAMAAASAYQQESVDNTLIESFCNDLIVRYGSIVKAWRRVLDPNRHGELLFNEFVEGLARTSYHGDTSALWMALLRRARARGKDHALALFEFSPQSSTLMETFRQWTIAKFGGPIHMFKAMVSSSNAAVTLDQFVEICRAHEFTEDAERIFIDAFDLHNSGLITVDDIAFLEADGFKRRAAIEPTFIMQIEKGKEKQAKVISRQAAKKKAQDAANREFQQRVRAVSGGSFIRGWRNILDLDGNMTISKCELLKACKKIAFKGEVAALWKAIDLDDDGAVHCMSGRRSWQWRWHDLRSGCKILLESLVASLRCMHWRPRKDLETGIRSGRLTHSAMLCCHWSRLKCQE